MAFVIGSCVVDLYTFQKEDWDTEEENAVNARSRFLDIAHFERPNDPFVWSIWTWRETITRWKQEGDPVNLEGKQFNEFHVGS